MANPYGPSGSYCPFGPVPSTEPRPYLAWFFSEFAHHSATPRPSRWTYSHHDPLNGMLHTCWTRCSRWVVRYPHGAQHLGKLAATNFPLVQAGEAGGIAYVLPRSPDWGAGMAAPASLPSHQEGIYPFFSIQKPMACGVTRLLA